MTKKEYLLELIEKLWEEREIGYALKKLIENNLINNDIIDAIYEIVHYSVKTVVLEKKSEKLQKSLIVLEKIKKLENKDQERIDEELKSMISNI